jgi:hypothetical protein
MLDGGDGEADEIVDTRPRAVVKLGRPSLDEIREETRGVMIRLPVSLWNKVKDWQTSRNFYSVSGTVVSIIGEFLSENVVAPEDRRGAFKDEGKRSKRPDVAPQAGQGSGGKILGYDEVEGLSKEAVAASKVVNVAKPSDSENLVGRRFPLPGDYDHATGLRDCLVCQSGMVMDDGISWRCPTCKWAGVLYLKENHLMVTRRLA